MNLTDTVKKMESNSYKDRFIAEYQQTKIRYEKLKKFCNRIEAAYIVKGIGINTITEPQHDCPLDLLREQQNVMGVYLGILEKRAIIEGVDLDEE